MMKNLPSTLDDKGVGVSLGVNSNNVIGSLQRSKRMGGIIPKNQS